MFTMTGEASQCWCLFFLGKFVHVLCNVSIFCTFSWWFVGFLVSGRGKYHIAVAGRGMQMVEFSPPEDNSMEAA
jgi:hypothetical protein